MRGQRSVTASTMVVQMGCGTQGQMSHRGVEKR
jgi:hypothetical protein